MGTLILWTLIAGVFTRLALGSWLLGLIGFPLFVVFLVIVLTVHSERHPERTKRVEDKLEPPPLIVDKGADRVPTVEEIAFWDAVLEDD